MVITGHDCGAAEWINGHPHIPKSSQLEVQFNNPFMVKKWL